MDETSQTEEKIQETTSEEAPQQKESSSVIPEQTEVIITDPEHNEQDGEVNTPDEYNGDERGEKGTSSEHATNLKLPDTEDVSFQDGADTLDVSVTTSTFENAVISSQCNYGRNDSHILPFTSASTSFANSDHVPDNSSPKVRLTNSKDIHVGTRINYVTKVIQANNSPSIQDSEDLKRIDDAVLLTSSKLRLWYSTENAYMPSLVCYERSHDFSIRDCYLLPIINEYKTSGNLKTTNVSLRDIFFYNQRDVPAKRILLTGNSGCGKTSILKKFLYDWATLNPENNYLFNFDVVLIINLATLLDRTVEEMIGDVLFETRDEKRREFLHKTKLQFLVLLDGFDDLATSKPVIDFLTAKQSCVFSANMTVVVTSLPHCLMPIRKCFQCHFDIEGFSEVEKDEYINFRLPEDDSKESFYAKLEKNRYLSEIAKNPLMLHMLCCLHEEGKLYGYTNMIREIFCSLIRRYHQKYGRSSRALKSGKTFAGEDLLARFGRIALLHLNKEICCVKLSILKSEFPNQDEYEFITQLGYLITNHWDYYRQSPSYDAIHSIFFEYTAAIYLTKNVEDVQRVLNCDTYQFDISNVIIFLVNMYEDTSTLLAIINPVELNDKMFFDDYYRIVRKVDNSYPFLEDLRCRVHEASPENISTLLSYNETKSLSIYLTYKEYTVELPTILSSIKGCSSLRKLKIEKAITICIYPGVDTWCVTWYVDMVDEFDVFKEIINIEMKVDFYVLISPKSYICEIEDDGEYTSTVDSVSRYVLPQHEHLGMSERNCYQCMVAYQHEITIACSGMNFILPLHGFYIFDSKYKKLVIFRVPEKDRTLFEQPGIFQEIAEGMLGNNIDFEIW